jgi:polyisoprenoid-binding protein YceI
VHFAIEPKKPEVATVHYGIETRGSTFTVRAYATGLLSAFAHSPTISIPDFEGEILLDPEAVEDSSVSLVVHANSLTVIGDVNDKDRQEINNRTHREVLESDSFAEISYECSSMTASKTGEGQYSVALNGQLTLHGVTRTQPVSARVWLNGDMLRAVGEVSIRQSDYEILPVSAAGGTIKIKDELKLSFDISARKKN